MQWLREQGTVTNNPSFKHFAYSEENFLEFFLKKSLENRACFGFPKTYVIFDSLHGTQVFTSLKFALRQSLNPFYEMSAFWFDLNFSPPVCSTKTYYRRVKLNFLVFLKSHILELAPEQIQPLIRSSGKP